MRGVAAESRHGHPAAVPVLISAVNDQAVDVRFWAVWSLGGQRTNEVRQKLEPILAAKVADEAIHPGWWSVGHEALAVLGEWNLPGTEYGNRFEKELTRIEQDPQASIENARWAKFWA